jgi:threonyl-tRNA synthetase
MPKILIIPIKDTFLEYSTNVMIQLLQVGLDAEINSDYNESLNTKINSANNNGDLIVIVGAEEVTENKITLRKDDKGTMISVDQLVQMLLDENIGD